MSELKPCPFCGGEVRIWEGDFTTLFSQTKAKCSVCRMEFEYHQYFEHSEEIMGMVVTNSSFKETWNMRVEESNE